MLAWLLGQVCTNSTFLKNVLFTSHQVKQPNLAGLSLYALFICVYWDLWFQVLHWNFHLRFRLSVLQEHRLLPIQCFLQRQLEIILKIQKYHSEVTIPCINMV